MTASNVLHPTSEVKWVRALFEQSWPQEFYKLLIASNFKDWDVNDIRSSHFPQPLYADKKPKNLQNNAGRIIISMFVNTIQTVFYKKNNFLLKIIFYIYIYDYFNILI